MLTYLMLGIVLGTTAGISPGPMMTLVIAQSLRFGVREGLKLAIAPLLSDLPIVAITWIILSRVAEVDRLLGVIALTGAGLLLVIAAGSWRTESSLHSEDEALPPRSLLTGALANLLNPHPWLFWLTIGSPILVQARQTGGLAGGLAAGLAFLLGFYACLIGAKVVIAAIVGHYGRNLSERWYRLIRRGLAIILALIALQMIWVWGRRISA